MDFERFIEKINNNIEYKSIVKKVLSNEPCSLQDAKEYLVSPEKHTFGV